MAVAAWTGRLAPGIAVACHTPRLMDCSDAPGSSGSAHAVAWQTGGLVLGSRSWQGWDWRACSSVKNLAWWPATSILSPDLVLVHTVKQQP